MVPGDEAHEQEPGEESPVEAPARGGLPRIEGYRVEGLLGRGATGVVYSAVQLAVDRPVALKILHPDLVGSKRAIRRLQREARTAARLAHPAIITAIDMGEQDGQWWYAMELVEGISLSERIREKGPLTEREALRFFIPLCDGLHHARQAGVVHRDVKPANILIDSGGRARLVDLGLAFSEDDPMLTRAGGTLGTPHYISPEQARDPTTVDIRSDIWSLGATLYHSVCGHPPFEGESVAEILSGVLYERVPEPRLYAPDLSKGLSLVLRKCLTRDPYRRYQEPIHLMRDLERIRERRTPHVRASGLDPVDTGRPEWLSRALVLGAATITLVGGALLVTEPWKDRPREPLPQDAPSWPRLEGLARSFAEGKVAHAAVLAELQDIRAPGAAKEGLEAEVVEDLRAVLGTIQEEVGDQLTAALREHDFPRGERLLGAFLSERLQRETGFRQVDLIPVSSFGMWLEGRIAELGEARSRAVDDGKLTLARYFDRELVPRLDEALRRKRWREALATLQPTAAWLTEGEVDARGLAEIERGAILASVDAKATLRRPGVKNDYHRLDGRLKELVDSELDSLKADLRQGRVTDPDQRLQETYQTQREALGIVPENVPLGWLNEPSGSLAKLREGMAELRREQQRRFDETARAEFDEDLLEVAELCRKRRYRQVEELWEQRLEDDWRSAVRPRMERRLREAQHLSEILKRAAEGVRLRKGKTFSPLLGGIPYEGARIRTGENVLGQGFELEPRDVRRFQVHLVVPDPLPSGDKVLRAEDLLALADLDASPLWSFRRALFLFHEDRYAEAAEALPRSGADAELADLSSGPDGLEERIRRALEVHDRERSGRRKRMHDTVESIRTKSQRGGTPTGLKADIDRLFQGYGDILPEDVRREMVARRERLESKPAPKSLAQAYGARVEKIRSLHRGVALEWPFGSGAPGSTGGAWGAWNPGDWQAVGDGLQLLRDRETDGEFWDRARSPALALVPPLDVGQGLVLRLEMRTIHERPQRNELVLSVAGLHLVFVEDPEHPVFLAGPGDGTALLNSARQLVGSSSGFRGFPKGESFQLEIEVRPNRTRSLRVSVDGTDLDPGSLPRWEIPDDPQIRLHTSRPLELLAVRLEGQRLPGR